MAITYYFGSDGFWAYDGDKWELVKQNSDWTTKVDYQPFAINTTPQIVSWTEQQDKDVW